MFKSERKQIGERIYLYRKQSGYSQIELANICSIDKTNLGRIERGEVSVRIDTLILISRALGVTPSELLKNIN